MELSDDIVPELPAIDIQEIERQHSQVTLQRVELNDTALRKLWIADYGEDSVIINSIDGSDFSRLGTCIARNTHLTSLHVNVSDLLSLELTSTKFYDDLKRNKSICELMLDCTIVESLTRGFIDSFTRGNIFGGVAHKILEAYQENKNLTALKIYRADLQNGGEHVIAQTLSSCANLKKISIVDCNISDEQLLSIVDAIRGHRSLEKLYLCNNRIGNDGCGAIATLLSDPTSNLHTLDLFSDLIHNLIGGEGAITLASSLANNTKLRHLYLAGNQIDQRVVDIFNKLLCNKSSIKDTYFSNHTLETLHGISQHRGDELDSLLKTNKCTNKSHVAIKKILKYHPNIDMEPLFEWNMEGEDERDLKALPFVIAWFDRAGEAVADEEEEESYKIDERKLSAMYQFVKAMPLLFVPNPHDKGVDNKRKRNDI